MASAAVVLATVVAWFMLVVFVGFNCAWEGDCGARYYLPVYGGGVAGLAIIAYALSHVWRRRRP